MLTLENSAEFSSQIEPDVGGIEPSEAATGAFRCRFLKGFSSYMTEMSFGFLLHLETKMVTLV